MTRALLLASVVLIASAIPANAHLTARALRQSVAFEPALGARVPLDLRFRDEFGRDVTLADVVAARPALVTLVDYDCTDLCPITLRALSDALRGVDLAAGRDFDVVAVGFDSAATPRDATRARDAILARESAAGAASRPLPGWHFVIGEAAAVDRLAHAIGFRTIRDDESGRVAHPAGVVLVAGDGTIARAYFGAAFTADALRDGIVETAHGRIGTLPDRVWLLCHGFDPQSGRYEAAILGGVRTIAVTIALILAAMIAWLSGLGRARTDEPRRRAE